MAGIKKGCIFGLLFGSLLKLVVSLAKGLIYVLAMALIYLGLWVPLIYVVIGLILFFAIGFNPFFLDIWGQLYFAGFVATGVVALIISVRNVILKPLKSVSDGYKNPLWKREKAEEERAEEEKRRTDELLERAAQPQKTTVREIVRDVPREDPLVYESALEFGSIVHEYSDRFEVYVLKNGRLVLDKVEMKNEEF